MRIDGEKLKKARMLRGLTEFETEGVSFCEHDNG